MQIGLGLWLGTRQVGGFSPATLFSAGEPGGWYDPSDLSTMFQDTAGTTPVTATGQTVGLLLDKSGRGNHLTQATAASRPIYGIEPFGGRRNLLTWTEQFDNAAWIKGNTTVTANSTVAPDGTSTGDAIYQTTATSVQNMTSGIIVGSSGTAYTFSIYLKAGTSRYAQVTFPSTTMGSTQYANIDITGVTITASAASTASVVDVGNGWVRVKYTVVAVASSNVTPFIVAINSGTDARGASITGDAANYFFLWGAQLETGSLATPYQRVTDQWNVTEAGVPSVSYVQYDGTDDWFISPTITPGIDKAQIFAGVRKLSDAAQASLVELSATASINPGAFALQAPRNVSVGNYTLFSGGTLLQSINPTGFFAPITNVLTGIGDIAGDVVTLRVNGLQAATSASDQGTGNFLAYPLYVGRRGGTSLPFNGRLYQLLVRFGANLDAATIAATEAFVNSRTGAF